MIVPKYLSPDNPGGGTPPVEGTPAPEGVTSDAPAGGEGQPSEQPTEELEPGSIEEILKAIEGPEGQPVITPQPGAEEGDKGPIPYKRFQEVINERNTLRSQLAEAQQYGQRIQQLEQKLTPQNEPQTRAEKLMAIAVQRYGQEIVNDPFISTLISTLDEVEKGAEKKVAEAVSPITEQARVESRQKSLNGLAKERDVFKLPIAQTLLGWVMEANFPDEVEIPQKVSDAVEQAVLTSIPALLNYGLSRKHGPTVKALREFLGSVQKRSEDSRGALPPVGPSRPAGGQPESKPIPYESIHEATKRTMGVG